MPPVDVFPEDCPESFVSGLEKHGYDREFAQQQYVRDLQEGAAFDRGMLRQALAPDIRLWADMRSVDADVLEAQLRLEALGLEASVSAHEMQQASVPDLNDAEQTILEALRASGRPLKGAELARVAGYPHNSSFKSTCAALVRRKILRNERQEGYSIALRELSE